MALKGKDSQTSPQVVWIRILQGGADDSNLDHQSDRFENPYQAAFHIRNGKEPTAAAAGGCNMRMCQTAALALQQSVVKHDWTRSLEFWVGGLYVFSKKKIN